MNKREIILQKIKTVLIGLATVNTVYRMRAYNIDQASLPAIDIHWEQENSSDDETLNFLDRELVVLIRCFAKDSATQSADEILNQVCVEVTQMLAADNTLGLNFIIDSAEGAHITDVSGEASALFAVTTIQWTVLYRRSRIDPSL